MTIIEKIRKRIMSRQMMEGKLIKEIQITKQEAEQLGDKRAIDGVKLIIVDKLGDMSNKDCFAYQEKNGHKKCYCLNELYCKNKECDFYRTDIEIAEIESDIRKYSDYAYYKK